MPQTSPIYRAFAALARAGLGVVSRFDAKLARGHRGRIESPAEFTAWAAQHRDLSRPLIWCHAPSVGEGLQAQTVLRRIRRDHPDWQLAYTWFSPSAEPWAERLDVDVKGYLPYDLAGPVEAVLAALQPQALVFSKLDLWPELAVRAAARGVPVGLIAATVRPGSGRLRWPVRSLLEPGYRSVTAAAAISEEDAARLAQIGVPRDRIHVTGDPRFDSALERVQQTSPEDPLLRFGIGAPALVAGSTWPGDEAVLLGAMARVRQRHAEARLILVPHEPTEHHLQDVERGARALSLPVPQRSSTTGASAELLLVDRVGLLATLYGAGTMAYVGGGFHSAGLHSVLEPAAWGRPVAFGPRWQESRDAALLVDAGGAAPIAAESTTEAIAQLAGTWGRWLDDPARRAVQGAMALGLVTSGLGAADRAADLVEQLVLAGSPRR
ncbi:MAG: glycosyltransferase N-terminal domain-containing protein [Gemmatimonadota bacterium]